jgi:hypothetical protein
LLLRRASSDAMRVAAKAMAGCVHDPWIPIVVDSSPRALTAQSHTLGYRSLQGLLFDRTRAELPLLAKPSEVERRSLRAGTFVAQVLISGDGRTDGLVQRELPMPAAVVSRLTGEPELIATRARQFVELAGNMAGKVFRSALIQFVDGSDDVAWKNPDFDKAVAPWGARLDGEIDERFFAHLFDSVAAELDDTEAQASWVRWLEGRVWALLADATEALPTRDGQRWFARARAERFMRLALHKHFQAWRAPPKVAELPDAPEPDTETPDAQ